ncbi:MAG: ParB/RepB/Spo0J family partition protein [Neoaquamicrobium sediminum]
MAHVAAEAADARAMLAGRETVQELDPDLFSPSAISDRIPTSDDTRYQILKETIRENGQLIPIIARPDPIREGKFQVAAGHRRWRAAKELGQPVRAIIRSLSDQEVVVVQGQENGARADLSFIERARFAGQLSVYGYSRDTVATALNVDKPEEMGGAGSRESDAATRGLLVCNIVCK